MTQTVAQIVADNGHVVITSADPSLRRRPTTCDRSTGPVDLTDTGGCKHCADDIIDLAWKAGGIDGARIRLGTATLISSALVADLIGSPGTIGYAHLADPVFAQADPTPTNDPHDRIDPVVVHRGRNIHFAHTRRCAQSDGTWYACTIRPRTTLCGQPLGPPGNRTMAGRRTCPGCLTRLDHIVAKRHTKAVAALRVAGIDIDAAGELADVLIQTVLADPVTASANSADHALPDPPP